jgi:hypothetical protein
LLLLLITVIRVAFVTLWIAVAPGEARVTIRYMYRALAPILGVALAAVFALGACGDERSGPTQADLDEARAEAAAATDAVDRLEGRLESLENELDRSAEAADAFGKKLREATKSLRVSLGDIRGSLGEIRSLATGAASDAESAAGQIGAVVRDLSVLEDRFNFHLRSHGG